VDYQVFLVLAAMLELLEYPASAASLGRVGAEYKRLK
jgi:hypothetical protein